MHQPAFTRLADRGILAVAGPDARPLLQGLLSNDLARVDESRAIHAALLTPQGKFLFEMFVSGSGDTLRLESEAARLPDLLLRLRRYRLRAQVSLEIDAAAAVFAAWGDDAADRAGLPAALPGAARAFAGGRLFVDPRLPGLGLRAHLPDADAGGRALAAAGFALADAAAYDRRRIAAGVPDGSRDLVPEKSILLECGFEELNGVDFGKGCYVGQELTARTKYRALIKRRLVPVKALGPLPPPGTPVEQAGATVGEIRSGAGERALALLRLEPLAAALAGTAPLTAAGVRLVPEKPAWAAF